MKKIAAILMILVLGAGCVTATRSPIQEACYNADYHSLTIEFSDGSRYRYLDVPPGVFQELYASKAKGRYFNHEIRSKYEARRLSVAMK